MEAIKKKVQAMKVEKDNLCDKCDEVEQVTCDLQCRSYRILASLLTSSQKMKEALIRRDKAEEEFTELNQKSKTLEIDLDKFAEKLEKQIFAQEAKEAQVLAAEAEFNRLNRR